MSMLDDPTSPPPILDHSPKRFVFVIMPFAPEFEDIYDSGIKEACHVANAYCERVDEQIYDGTVLDRIYNQIEKADLVVSDMTGNRPNVFYETGYAHALGRRVILLAQKAEEIPFDLKSYPHLVYEGSIKRLKNELPRQITHFLEHPGDVTLITDRSLKYVVGGLPLEEGSTVEATIPVEVTRNDITVKLRFAVNNPTPRIFEGKTLEFGMIVPSEFSGKESQSTAPDGKGLANQLILLPGQKNLHLIGGPERVLPEGWWTKDIAFPVNDWRSLRNRQMPCILRIFTETGCRDIGFQLTVT